MTSDLTFETSNQAGDPHKEWGMHNGVVVLVALALVALSVLLEVVQPTSLMDGAPVWAFNIVSGVSFALLLAAGTVMGMLVATRMLQVHVGPRGARMLALWGILAMVLSLVLRAVLFAIDIRLQDAGRLLIFTGQAISNVVAATLAVGAAMVALAFVARLRR